MMSLQRTEEVLTEETTLSKKRKLDGDDDDDPSDKPNKAKSMEWQRCLDIKSGQIYFYNARTKKKTLGDPKPAPMSLELELNPPIQSQSQSPSWLKLEADEEEMVAAVCRKCYMLVMMLKSSPTCPNCKFLHPLSLSSSVFLSG